MARSFEVVGDSAYVPVRGQPRVEFGEATDEPMRSQCGQGAQRTSSHLARAVPLTSSDLDCPVADVSDHVHRPAEGLT